MKIALAQMNATVGDVQGNAKKVLEALARADDEGAQLVALPELVITGYPPEDLVLRKEFVRANRHALEEIAAAAGDAVAVVGFVDAEGFRLYNAAAVCQRGELLGVYRKHLLPNYGVFDERRYFTPGRGHLLLESSETTIGVCVCEDIWSDQGPAVTQGDAGAQIVININASPFHKGKLLERADMLAQRARRARAAIVYVNMVGGQDELIFDGGSSVVSASGETLARLPQFEEHFVIVDVSPSRERLPGDGRGVKRIPVELRAAGEATRHATVAQELSPEEEIYSALRLALSDYVIKNGFERVVVGLSGGIDSSLTATLAADALGSNAVLGVSMPSQYSSEHSIADAAALADNLGIELHRIPIADIYGAYLEALETAFGPTTQGLAEENIQARIRGALLMAISNRYGPLVLATGNKSEGAVGYATLYGDMAGGFAPLKDLLKREVYALARWRNSISEAIPQSVFGKAPSAELRPEQRDEDTLPPYEILDRIVERYVEEDAGVDDIVAAGLDRETVDEVVRMVDLAEYKRRQAAPGPKVTVKAFGRDRRLPITNRWRW